MMASREEGMPAIGSPLRRKRLQTEDNIRISTHLSAANLRRPRINTLNNEEEDRPSRQVSLRKATSKMTLSPIKFYETRLAVSCEAWSAFSITEGTYKRGWKPNRLAEFNGLVRVVVGGVWLGLLERQVQMGRASVRTNRCLLMAQEERSSVRDLHRPRVEEGLLAENTIMPLRDLIAAMLITNSNELLLYSAVFLGYLLRLGQPLDIPNPIIIDSFTEANACTQAFITEANQQLGERYPNSRLEAGLELTSTPHELSQYFSELLGRHRGLVGMLEAKEVVSAIRFQVGFKFYEERTKRFPSERSHPSGHVVVSCRGRNNYGVVSLNKANALVIVLHDCKFSMADVDINRIEDWFRSTNRLDPKPEPKQSRLLPLLKLLQ